MEGFLSAFLIIIGKQAVFKEVNICSEFSGKPGEAVPSEYCAANVVFLGAGVAALAFLHAEYLLAFPVVLLSSSECRKCH